MNRPPESSRSNRLKLILLAGIFVLPLLLGWLAHRFGWAPGTTANYGSLVQPRELPDVALVGRDGARARLSAWRGKWILLHFDSARCDAYCEKKLYFMRQIRRALGNDMRRVERVWLVTGDSWPAAPLVEAISGTHVLRANNELSVFFAGGGTSVDHLFLIDPLGQWMMSFPRDPDPSKILKDLQRLMKYSGAG